MIQKLLGFDKQTMRIRTEVIAGITTFLTMSYILAVNPSILGTTGMDKGAVFTATALASAIATLLLAFMAKLPFAQAPSIFCHVGNGYFGEITFCPGSGYGVERFFCLYVSAGHGIFLADGDDGDVCRRGDIHPYYFSEYPGDHT